MLCAASGDRASWSSLRCGRDARSLSIYAGTSEMQRMLLAQKALGI